MRANQRCLQHVRAKRLALARLNGSAKVMPYDGGMGVRGVRHRGQRKGRVL